MTDAAIGELAEPNPDTADRCVLGGPAMSDLDESEVVPAALRHLRGVARHTCRTAVGNGCYPPELAVATLADTAAALAHLADQVGPYVGDFWPTAGSSGTMRV